MIGAFVPLYAAARRWLDPKMLPHGREWEARDAIVAAVLALATVGLTSPLAMGDERLQRRFADDQLQIDAGFEINKNVGEVLKRGCRVFTPTGSIYYIVAFAPYRSQIETYFHTLPLNNRLTNELNGSTGCTAVLNTSDRAHPSVQNFIESYARAHDLKKIAEGNGLELLVTPQ